jgi:hypothetical protein
MNRASQEVEMAAARPEPLAVMRACGRPCASPLAVALLCQALVTSAFADSSLPPDPPRLSALISEASWESAAAPEATAEIAELSLAQRVEALERYIRDQERVKSAATLALEEESLPGVSAQTVPAECVPKKIDIISKPVVQLKGRILVDGIIYDDDDETTEFFNRDRENEFGFDTGSIWRSSSKAPRPISRTSISR